MCFYKFVKIVVRRVLGVRSSPLGRSSTAACHGSPGWDRDIARRRFPAGGRPRDSLWCFRGLLSRRFLWRTCRPVGATFGRAIERSSSAWCVVGGEPAAVGGRGGNSACFGPTPLLGSLLCYFAKVHRSPALPRVEPPGTALIWVAHCGQFRVSSAPAWWWAVAWVDFYLFFYFFYFSPFVPFAETKKDLIDTLILPLHPRASLPCRPRVPRRLASATTSRTPSAGGAGSAASTFSVRRFFILRALVWCLAPCDGSWFALRPTAQAIILMCCLLCVCVAGRSCRWLHCRRTVASFCIIGPEGDRRLLTSPSVHRYR